ncbi:MAG: tRNA preQ1(34) S-adenosylmethionine ribosyltransferase-isomerase QueA [Pyrinomonadaceae bacterium]|nr:tRNA preQ1(34) S-adenosylmethionine ribosyltransferase-isomerase QueA [Pyrinomonadaceae bacterium]
MHISEFDYELPEELIAQQPLPQRDASRMLVVDREKKAWVDTDFASLPDYVRENDVLVVNNTSVFPARLVGQRDPSGGRVEVLLVRECGPSVWEALVKPGARLSQGARMKFGDSRLRADVLDAPGNGLRQLRFEYEGQWEAVLEEVGETPLPPYIIRPAGASPADRERYQTIFARQKGAIAAPTAGLHFTPQIFDRVLARGAKTTEITLHVGYGTFEPVRVTDVAQHRVASEEFELSDEAASTINDARARGGRVIAVGTTTARALEAAINDRGQLEPARSRADLTIVPGYKFRIIDALLTNFHLPGSSLLLLVCAFAGCKFVLQAYRHAVDRGYRFYSFGDCMLLI